MSHTFLYPWSGSDLTQCLVFDLIRSGWTFFQTNQRNEWIAETCQHGQKTQESFGGSGGGGGASFVFKVISYIDLLYKLFVGWMVYIYVQPPENSSYKPHITFLNLNIPILPILSGIWPKKLFQLFANFCHQSAHKAPGATLNGVSPVCHSNSGQDQQTVTTVTCTLLGGLMANGDLWRLTFCLLILYWD